MITVIPFPVKPKETLSYTEEAFQVRKQAGSNKDAADDVRATRDRAAGSGEDEGFASVLGRVAEKTDTQRATDKKDSLENGSSRAGRTETETFRTEFGRQHLKAAGKGHIHPVGMRNTGQSTDGESADGESAVGLKSAKRKEILSHKNFAVSGRKGSLEWILQNKRSAGSRSDRTYGNRTRTVPSNRFIVPEDSSAIRTGKETGRKNKTETRAAAGRKAAAKKALKRSTVVKGMKGSPRKGFQVDDRKMGAEESRQKPHTVKEFGRAHSIACERYETNLSRSESTADVRTFGTAGKSPDEIFGDIVRQFSFMVKKGGGEARLVLKPESLGEMKLNIRLNNAQVNTHMVVETTALRDMIVSRLSSLQDSLMSQGFSLGSFDVEVKDQNASNETGEKKSTARNLAVSGLDGVKEPEPPGEETYRSALPWISTVVNITV